MTQRTDVSRTAAPLLCSALAILSLAGRQAHAETSQVAHGQAVLTVAESKRLIAKAVTRMPIVQTALKNGMVIVCKGTTNTYVAEEFLGHEIQRGALVYGNVTPSKAGRKMPKVDPVPEVVLIKGQHRPDLSLDDALKRLSPGDVVIKGGNALDYANKTVGVWTGSPTGGTTAKIMPYVTSRKAHLVIPIGLEKLVAGKPIDIACKVNAIAESVPGLANMRILKGQIVTEIEALKILANVTAFQASAGGVGGAEGAVWMVWQGHPEDVEKAKAITADVQGEVPFLH
ncbi:MAG: hypothetical protein JXQ73_01925 [Phycisphaerae bacterium]|nr:hypothetical protein [Phycisphaerae bacterium]